MTSPVFVKSSRPPVFVTTNTTPLFLSFASTYLLNPWQHFELLPDPTLREAQKALLDEITPSIAHLLSVASNHIDKLARREEALKAKARSVKRFGS